MHHCKTMRINGTEFESARYIIDAQQNNWASLVAQTVKNLPAVQETQDRSLGREDALEEGMQPTPVLLPGKSHGQRSPVGYSPWGPREWDKTEMT